MKFPLRKSAPGRSLALPGKKGWLLWSFSRGSDFGPPKSEPLESPARTPAGTSILLPARQIVTVPLWLQTTDQTLLSGLVEAQLDRRGISHDRSVAWAFLPIAQEEGRSLVTAFLANPDLPPDLLAAQAGEYDLAARALPLEADSVTLWHEQEGLVAAFTREAHLVHLQFFPQTGRIAEIVVELQSLLAYLQWEKIVVEAPKVILWGDFSETDAASLQGALGIPPRREPLPTPHFPSPSLSLLPPLVRNQRQGDVRQLGKRRLFLAAAGLYLLLVLAVGGGLGWLKWQEKQLVTQLAAVTPDVDRLSQSASRWHALEPAIDPSYYPLECLLSSVQALPAEIRLTEFDHDPTKVLIMGEGKDAASIFKFLPAIEADPFLKKWQWTMPQPQLLPNNRAQFQIEGAREPAPAN